MRRVYMDHAAGMPVDQRVLDAMNPFFTTKYANASSTHSFGSETRQALENARSKVANLTGASKKEEIIFTSCGTESNNLAIKGAAHRYRNRGDHIVTSAVEHMSVINTCKSLGNEGFKVTYLPVDKFGMVDPKSLEEAMTEQTILVSVMYANGEVGTIQPIREIGKITHDKGAILHVDAVAAAGKVPINVQKEGIDLLSLSSNDMRGPRGVGALYTRSGVHVTPLLHGGGQEAGLRSGTENIAGIVGFGKAAEIAESEMEAEATRLSGLRDSLAEGATRQIPESYLNGHLTKRIPDNVNVRFSYIEGESLILSLDMEGVACSSSSACTSKTLEPSHVLLAMGLSHQDAHGSLLFTLGRQNTEEDVEYVLDLLPRIVKRLRSISPLTPRELIK